MTRDECDKLTAAYVAYDKAVTNLAEATKIMGTERIIIVRLWPGGNEDRIEVPCGVIMQHYVDRVTRARCNLIRLGGVIPVESKP